jgi:hypothetical protein
VQNVAVLRQTHSRRTSSEGHSWAEGIAHTLLATCSAENELQERRTTATEGATACTATTPSKAASSHFVQLFLIRRAESKAFAREGALLHGPASSERLCTGLQSLSVCAVSRLSGHCLIARSSAPLGAVRRQLERIQLMHA